MSNANLDTAKKLGQTGIKKYWKGVGSIEIELDWLIIEYLHRQHL